MTKKERIAELERKVAELEARTYYPIVLPFTSPPFGNVIYGRCYQCGGSNTIGHMCYGTYTTTNAAAAPGYLPSNLTVIGAAS